MRRQATDININLDIQGMIRPFETHLQAGLKSSETIDSYLRAVKLLCAFLERQGMPTNIEAISREHVEAFLAGLAAYNSSGTVINRFKGLRAFFRWLVDEDEISRSPLERIPWPKLTERPPKACSPEEVKRLLGTCDKAFRGRRDAALIGVMLDTGWRVSEVLQITVEMAQLGSRLSIVAKGQKVLAAKLTSPVQRLVDRYLRLRVSSRPELWLSVSNRPMSRGVVWAMLSERSKQAGIPHVYPHALRHSHAIWWLKEGGNVMDLKANLGHSSLKITERYLKYMEQDRALEARKKFGPGNLLGLITGK